MGPRGNESVLPLNIVADARTEKRDTLISLG